MNNFKMRRFTSASVPFLSGAVAIVLAIAIILSPESSFQASLQGLKLWWTLVFPALLPFLMLSEMLTATGFVHGLGVLLEPVMTRIFRLPGAGGWTLALGMTAGFPAGAGGVQLLHKQGSITDKEAGRLASIAHFASPVTLLIVVGVAFLHSPAAGYTLLAIHWISGLAAGVTATLLTGRPKTEAPVVVPSQRKTASLPRRMHQAVSEARARDDRGFGKLLGESVSTAVQSLMVIGGYMIMFAVVINIATSLVPQLPPALAASFLEIHLGANALTSELTAPHDFSSMGITGLALLSAALGWSGICGQLQALTLLKRAKISFLPYAAVRLLHGVFAFAFTLLLWTPLMNLRETVLPAVAGPEVAESTATLGALNVWNVVPQLLGLQSLLLLVIIALSAAVSAVTWLRRLNG